MNILRAIASFIVTNIAIAVISLSFLAWTIDATILQPPVLITALEKNGTSASIAKAIPELAVKAGNGPEAQQIKSVLVQNVTDEYVHLKLVSVVTGFTDYIKDGSSKPSLDLSDFPARLQKSGIAIPPEVQSNLSKPIRFDQATDGKAMKSLHQSYQILKLTKIIGPIVAVILLIISWLLAKKRHRASKLAAIFFTLGIWDMVYWLGIKQLPHLLLNQVDKRSSSVAVQNVLRSVLGGLSDLLARYFLLFGLACFAMAIVMYAVHMFWPKPDRGATPPSIPLPEELDEPLPVASTPKPPEHSAASPAVGDAGAKTPPAPPAPRADLHRRTKY